MSQRRSGGLFSSLPTQPMGRRGARRSAGPAHHSLCMEGMEHDTRSCDRRCGWIRRACGLNCIEFLTSVTSHLHGPLQVWVDKARADWAIINSRAEVLKAAADAAEVAKKRAKDADKAARAAKSFARESLKTLDDPPPLVR